jgi:hypothetical protein
MEYSECDDKTIRTRTRYMTVVLAMDVSVKSTRANSLVDRYRYYKRVRMNEREEPLRIAGVHPCMYLGMGTDLNEGAGYQV